MKNLLIVSILSVAMFLPIASCTTFGRGIVSWQDNVPQLRVDIFMFSKLATRITLTEAGMSANDVEVIEEYLVALKDLLAVPGQPNFTGARALVGSKLPQKYRVYGLTIVDILDRYLQTANLNIEEDNEAIITIISSGINGALEALQEFVV